jgi:glutaminyl-tRNA synthetase
MRDPVVYRIRHETHHRTGDAWCIYPMYDFAHPLSDAIEHITHSLCSLEYEDHRPLYDWFLEAVEIPYNERPRQIEFARLNVSHMITSKRRLLKLIRSGIVSSWDDPRMPTLTGLRRRGYTPEAIRDFQDRIGVAKSNSLVDFALLEHCVREDLNQNAQRVMAVINPLRLVIENYPENLVEEIEVDNNPEDPSAGKRPTPFSKVLLIERDDFMENPPKGFYRLSPGREIRLKGAYYITCTGFSKDDSGNINEVRCVYDAETRGGTSSDGRKIKGTSHWVSESHSLPAEVRLYDQLFTTDVPEDDDEQSENMPGLNKDSLIILDNCRVEPGLKNSKPGSHYQFLRLGYFCTDTASGKDGKLVFNRTATLKDTWSKTIKNI